MPPLRAGKDFLALTFTRECQVSRKTMQELKAGTEPVGFSQFDHCLLRHALQAGGEVTSALRGAAALRQVGFAASRAAVPWEQRHHSNCHTDRRTFCFCFWLFYSPLILLRV